MTWHADALAEIEADHDTGLIDDDEYDRRLADLEDDVKTDAAWLGSDR